MTSRDKITTYKALEKNTNKVVVLKVIKKDPWDTSLDDSINKLKEVDSPYVLKYIECYENEDEYTVWN